MNGCRVVSCSHFKSGRATLAGEHTVGYRRRRELLPNWLTDESDQWLGLCAECGNSPR